MTSQVRGWLLFLCFISVGNVLLWVQSSYVTPYNRRLHIEELRLLRESNAVQLKKVEALERLTRSNILLKETIMLDHERWAAQSEANKRNIEGR